MTRLRSPSPSSLLNLNPRTRSGLLQGILVFICVATTALYFNADKRMHTTYLMSLSGDATGDMPTSHRSLSSNHTTNHTTHHQHMHMHGNNYTQAQTQTDAQQMNFIEGQTSPYAYMFIIGGIDPSAVAYRGFLYNVMIAADILQKHGSTADIWLYLQMSPKTNATELPPDETKSLQALNIHIHYMEKPETASFTDINMEKFRILNLVQYRRVLFLDADVMPLVNMDYLFRLSDGEHPILQPNFVVATIGEPANGGCFMLEPKKGYYEQLLEVVERQRIGAKDLGYPFFDRVNGWGHSFYEHKDEWKGTKQSGNRWKWHGSHVDQGLLYYWTKYHQKAVTIFRGDVVENWVDGGNKTNGQPVLQATMDPSWIDQYAPPVSQRVTHQWSCDSKPHKPDRFDPYICKTPYYNYAHFTGNKKPWQQGFDAGKMESKRNRLLEGPTRAFYTGLFELSERLGWGITPENVEERLKAESPFGYMPNYHDMAMRQQGNYTAKAIKKNQQAAAKQTGNVTA